MNHFAYGWHGTKATSKQILVLFCLCCQYLNELFDDDDKKKKRMRKNEVEKMWAEKVKPLNHIDRSPCSSLNTMNVFNYMNEGNFGIFLSNDINFDI